MALRIGTAEAGGTFHTQGLALQAVLERQPALAPVQVVTSAGASLGNAEALTAGEIDLGFIAANWLHRALAAAPPFVHPLPLSAVAPMNVGPLFFIARADGPLRRMADLRGRRVAVGGPKSGMRQHASVILGALGIGLDGITAVPLDFAAGAAALAAGEIEAQLQCPLPNAVMTALDARLDLRVLAYDPGQLEALLAAVPAYRPSRLPRGALRGLEAESAQPGVLNLLVAAAAGDPERIAAVVAAIAAGAPALVAHEPLFAGLPALLRSYCAEGPVALHPGAVGAYRAAGLLA